jgi:predicted nucleic acid-binding protein
MARYLLDTNHASTLVTLHHALRHKVLQAINQGEVFYLTVPVITEAYFGMSVLPRVVANQAEWQSLRTTLPCLPLDETDAMSAAVLQLEMRQRGYQLDTVDALIAAIALRHDLILLTSDKDFSAIPNLRLENWR